MKKNFINKHFMLENDTARCLYHDYSAQLPIIDYHCHLDPKAIADNVSFPNLSQLWLGGDHYKWRAMRANGVSEDYITGDRSDEEKFAKWAETLPYTMRNPLYHWTHLELRRVFGIKELLNPQSAERIYEQCNALLAQPDFTAQGLIRQSNVEVICTTDDPIDSLEHHRRVREQGFATKVLPTWRPDRALMIETGAAYRDYLGLLSAAAGMEIQSYDDLLNALQRRHDYFAEQGCRLSDHGMRTFYAADYTEAELRDIFRRGMEGAALCEEDVDKFRSALLYELARMDYAKGWVQQFHFGVIRNNSPRMFKALGADAGFDAIDDPACAAAGHKFFGRLDESEELAKTILYNLNPSSNELVACMAATFNDGSCPGKMQFGSGWWFLDQEYGMRAQMNALSAMGLLSRFVGMLTDSRSFLSYPRHEYFRRILCNLIAEDVEKGKLPASELDFIGKMVADISYYNAKQYFAF